MREGLRSEFAIFGNGEFAEFLDSFFKFPDLKLVLVGILRIGHLLLLQLADELIFFNELVLEDVDLFFEGLELLFVCIEFELLFMRLIARLVEVVFEQFFFSVYLNLFLLDVEYFLVQELDTLLLETHLLLFVFELFLKFGDDLFFLLQLLILEVKLVLKLVDVFVSELDLGLERLGLVDLRVGEVLERLVGWRVVRVEVLLSQAVLELLDFVLVLLDFVLFFNEQLLEGLGLLSQLLLLVVGTVLVLDGLFELSFEDDQFVEGFVFVLFDVPVEFVCFSQLFIDPFELFAKSLAFLLVFLEFRLQLFGLSGH